MLVSKCKNSVFCAQFLFFFLVGTICGTWLYRCSDSVGIARLELTGLMTEEAVDWSSVLSVLRPLVMAGLACIHPFGYHVLPVLVTMRGLLMSYAFCAVLCAGLSPGPLILRGMLLLPLFYSLCRLACDRHAGMGASSG